MKIENEFVSFKTETKQKIGAVTYIVAARFHEKQDDLTTKLKRLLTADIKNHSNCTFADSQRGDVK